MTFLEFNTSTGLVRVEPRETGSSQTGYQPAGISGTLLKKTGEALRDALKSITSAADDALTAFAQSVKAPRSVSVELGVSFDVEGNAFIASVTAEASLKVTCTWERP